MTTELQASKHNILHLRSGSSLRVPSWRWECARLMRDGSRLARRLRRDADEFTLKAARFLTAYLSAEDDADMLDLALNWPHLTEAVDVFEAYNRLVKWEVEARLLANESIERIAARTRLAPGVVIWYEKLFFNVYDVLDNPGYISHVIMGESLQAGLTEREYDLLWKLYGYMGGGLVLDAVIDKRYAVTRPARDSEIEAFFNDDARRVYAHKASYAARTMPINSYTQQVIMEIHQRYLELQKLAEGSGSGGDMLSANIRAMLDNLPWVIGGNVNVVAASDPSTVVGRLSAPLAEADLLAGELRASDLMELSVGQEPQRLRLIQSLKFPEEKNDPEAVQ